MRPAETAAAKLAPDIAGTIASANSANATADRTRQQTLLDREKAKADELATKQARLSAVEAARTLGEFADFGLSHINSGINGTTGYNAWTSWMPNSNSKQMANHLVPAKANVAIGALQKMRRENPTGGALGNVSDKDMELLTSIQGSLDQSDERTLRETLDRLKYLQLKVEKVLPLDMDHRTYVALRLMARDPTQTGALPRPVFGSGVSGQPAAASSAPPQAAAPGRVGRPPISSFDIR